MLLLLSLLVPIESPLMVSYLSFIVSNIVSLTVFEIFDAKIL